MNENEFTGSGVAARILYVEDDFDSGELVQFLLNKENENYDVKVVATFAEAVKQIGENVFNLYIIDYCLPSKSGIQLCRHIRETDRETPILFYSAIGWEKDRELAMKAGATDYLVKPADLELLTKRVNQLLFKWALTK
jgi:DNA-binding response OmpR family regulator